MPTLLIGRAVTPFFAFSCSVLVSSLLSASVCTPSASAQQASASSQTNTGGGGAPLFRLPNFIGDRRVDDLYVYMHPTQKPSWDTYRKYVESINAPTVTLQPLRRSPDPSTATNTGTIGTTLQAAAGSAVGSLTGSNSSGSDNTGTNNTTSGNGSDSTLAGQPQSSPPLVDTMTPPEATASNFDLPSGGAVTNVSGMVVGPGSDLVPGLMP